jgi:hypothetical protein
MGGNEALALLSLQLAHASRPYPRPAIVKPPEMRAPGVAV